MSAWEPDSLLEGHVSQTIPLTDEPTYAFEPEGSLEATLVRRGQRHHRRAMLYVHGWSDYFFQSHLGEALNSMGRDFYAIDLRRYGRSLKHGQLAGYVPSLEQYFVELDEAVARIRAEGHERLEIMGHSTGGLVVSLYAAARPGTFDAVVLNAPWIEWQGSSLARPAMHPFMRAVSKVAPTTALPSADNGFYRRSISLEEDGEWDYDLHLKGDPAFLVRVGWLEAVLAGQARVAAGLDIDAPILVLTSARSTVNLVGGKWTDDHLASDIVLDVNRIAERAPYLGARVMLVRLEGALHDVMLSNGEVRGLAAEEIERFLTAYAG